MTDARRLIEQSRQLLEESSASPFLGRTHHGRSPLNNHAPAGKRRAALRVIDGKQEEKIACAAAPEWRKIRTAPFCRDLELAVIYPGGVHALVFPCRRLLHGWVKTNTGERVDVHPTHWREWTDSNSALYAIGLSS